MGALMNEKRCAFMGKISVGWTGKETAARQGCHTAVEKTGVGDPHLV